MNTTERIVWSTVFAWHFHAKSQVRPADSFDETWNEGAARKAAEIAAVAVDRLRRLENGLRESYGADDPVYLLWIEAMNLSVHEGDDHAARENDVGAGENA